MKQTSKTRAIYKRFMITMPGYLAAQISAICEADGLNHPGFFCEAAQAYLAAKSRKPLIQITRQQTLAMCF